MKREIVVQKTVCHIFLAQKGDWPSLPSKERRGNRMNLHEECRAECISILPHDKFKVKLSKRNSRTQVIPPSPGLLTITWWQHLRRAAVCKCSVTVTFVYQSTKICQRIYNICNVPFCWPFSGWFGIYHGKIFWNDWCILIFFCITRQGEGVTLLAGEGQEQREYHGFPWNE